jgi:anti-sigma regulatory factor (Ser/Thr protein kinase)
MGKEVDAWEVEHRLTAELGSITAARVATGRFLDACAYPGPRGDVLLVVTELVTNALLHGTGSPVLRLAGGRRHVRVEVDDAGPALPRPRSPGGGGGWGLHVVASLGSGWGVVPYEGGKVVWCELTAGLAPAGPVMQGTGAC